jgi:hypothetical protein
MTWAYLGVFKSYTQALVSLRLLCITGTFVPQRSDYSTVKDEEGSVSTSSACFEGGALFLWTLSSLKLLCTTGILVPLCSASSTVKD